MIIPNIKQQSLLEDMLPIAQRIVQGEKVNEILDNYGRHHATVLDIILRKNGYKTYQSHSRCSKASFESHLTNSFNKKAHITASNFLGQFVQVEAN
jgi:hypothetical protein